MSQKSAGGSEKKKRDKNKPENEKKPLSPFFMFMNANKDKVKEQNKEAKHIDLQKIMGELWKNLSDD